jgi:hypothetical protein
MVPHDISDCTLPIVVMAKRGSEAFPVCARFKVSMKWAIFMEHYFLPKIYELLAKISYCKFFTKLYLIKAYLKKDLILRLILI